MKVKTYGINGLSEWYGDIKAGSISVKVSFVGGTASPSGAQPAYFVTKCPITQFVIENSKEYKSGFIHLEMSQEIPGNHRRMAIPSPVAPSAPVAPTAPANQQTPVVEQTTKTPDEAPSVSNESGEGSEAGDGVQTIEVSCKADAVEWLKDHYPDKCYNGNTLRAGAAFEAACNEAGVKFIINA